MSIQHIAPKYCEDHSNCEVLPIPYKYRMGKISESEIDKISYIGVGSSTIGNACYLKFCGEKDNKMLVVDGMGKQYEYDRKFIISYIPLPEKQPDNNKEHTVVVRQKLSELQIGMKCFYCNKDAKEFLVYTRDGLKQSTGVCGHLCISYFERTIRDTRCVECGGSGLFEQKWTAFQNKEIDRIIRFRCCGDDAECMENVKLKFEKALGREIYDSCICNKSFENGDYKLCGRCRNQKYCSKECQVEDWNVHKKMCKPI
jgi:hypothetical protein